MDKMDKKQLEGAPKKVGELEGKDVYQVKTRGGLYMIGTLKSNGMNLLGSGNHRRIAMIIAQRNAGDIVWTELSKSEHIDEEKYESVIQEYSDFTDELIKAQNKE